MDLLFGSTGLAMKPGSGSSRTWLIPSIVLLGLALRAWHYFRCPAVWHDEAVLLINVFELDFAQLLGPLLWHEAAPPLFLWIERAVYLTLGDHIQLLRLLPFLASCAALLLLVRVARAILPAQAVPWALLLFACGDRLAWHACEAKPYAFDILAAVLLFRVCCAGLSLLSRLLLLTLLAPFLILVSYPACFLFGSVLLALLPEVWRDGRPRVWSAYAGLILVVSVSFLFLMLGPARAQKDVAIMSCWLDFFPDLSRPWTVPGWVVTSTAELYRYCLPPLGQILALFALTGTIVLWRRGQKAALCLLVAPGFLVLGASFARCYPYGGARVTVFLVPAVVLLVAAGVPVILGWLRQRGRLAAAVAIILLLLPVKESLQRLAQPWRRADVDAAAAWVLEQRREDDVVLGNDWTCFYYCRHLGDRFRPLDDSPHVLHSRSWIIFIGRMPAENRHQAIRDCTPADWRVLEHRDFLDATAVLLVAPEADPSLARTGN